MCSSVKPFQSSETKQRVLVPVDVVSIVLVLYSSVLIVVLASLSLQPILQVLFDSRNKSKKLRKLLIREFLE